MLDTPEANRPWDKQKTPLQVPLMRAYRWLQMLEEGKTANLNEIVRREGTDICYVARASNLTTPAPEIVESILDDSLSSDIGLNAIGINPHRRWTTQISLLNLQ